MEIQLPRCRYSAQQHKPVLLPVWPTFTLASWSPSVNTCGELKTTTTTAGASFLLHTSHVVFANWLRKKYDVRTHFPQQINMCIIYGLSQAQPDSRTLIQLAWLSQQCVSILSGANMYTFGCYAICRLSKWGGKKCKKQPSSSLLAASRLALCLHICRLSPGSIPSSRLRWRLIVTCWRRRDSPHGQPPVARSSEVIGKMEPHQSGGCIGDMKPSRLQQASPAANINLLNIGGKISGCVGK